MGRANIYPVYDQSPADYSIFHRKMRLRSASDGYGINGIEGGVGAGTEGDVLSVREDVRADDWGAGLGEE
jgi:hypothetical protein